MFEESDWKQKVYGKCLKNEQAGHDVLGAAFRLRGGEVKKGGVRTEERELISKWDSFGNHTHRGRR
jgi:hypothetical protein